MFSPYLSVIQSSNIPIDSTEAEHGEEREGDGCQKLQRVNKEA